MLPPLQYRRDPRVGYKQAPQLWETAAEGDRSLRSLLHPRGSDYRLEKGVTADPFHAAGPEGTTQERLGLALATALQRGNPEHENHPQMPRKLCG